MKTQSLLNSKKCVITDKVSVHIPTIGEIYDYGENDYYGMAQSLTSTPYDLMVQLDDIGIDYETVNQYALFLMLLDSFRKQGKNMSIILEDVDLSELRLVENTQTKQIVLIDSFENVVIDKVVAYKIAAGLRKIHFWKKNLGSAGNDAAKAWILERKRAKLKRAKSRTYFSFLDDKIIQMVNTEEFKYNYEQCMDLSIYKFNASCYQIPKKRNWDSISMGAYFGTVDMSKIDTKKIHWLSQCSID